jgi:hypothetical protein
VLPDALHNDSIIQFYGEQQYLMKAEVVFEERCRAIVRIG